ncbi:MAG: hypothetical protein ACJ73S_19065 [Mycobacteriales bacterium]
MSDPIKVFAVIVLLSLPTVMFGGFSLLRLLGRGKLTDFQTNWFRAGHAHAGVLLVMSLAVLDMLARTDSGDGLRWLIGCLLAAGALAQSGGMFVHMAIGRPGRWSHGNSLTTAGGLALAAGLILTAYAVLAT